MNLYKLTDSLANLLLDESLDDDSKYPRIEELSIERDIKIDNCLKHLKNLEAEREAVIKEIDRLKEKKQSIEKSIDSTKEYICICLFPGERWSNGIFRVTKGIAESVETFDESSIPEEYMTTKVKTEVKPNKELIMKMMKAGVKVPECRIKTKEYLRIS